MDALSAADAGTDGPRLRRPSPLSATSSRSPTAVAAAAAAAAAPVLDADLYPGERRSLAGIAARAFGLGAALAGSVLGTAYLAGVVGTPLWRLPFFVAALALFHFLEFWTTAQYNTPAAGVDAFLLTANWPGYAIAHASACAECLLRLAVFRRRWWWSWGTLAGWTTATAAAWLPAAWRAEAEKRGPALLVAAGLLMVAVGQAVRTAAMVHAGRSFNHTIQQQRAASHALVTTGIYGWLRHPSYFGFFWWALGTQVVLGNTLCLAGYAAVLWRFFALRIRHEEQLLVRFFGDDYIAYRQRVGTKIPFVSDTGEASEPAVVVES